MPDDCGKDDNSWQCFPKYSLAANSDSTPLFHPSKHWMILVQSQYQAREPRSRQKTTVKSSSGAPLPFTKGTNTGRLARNHGPWWPKFSLFHWHFGIVDRRIHFLPGERQIYRKTKKISAYDISNMQCILLNVKRFLLHLYSENVTAKQIVYITTEF